MSRTNGGYLFVSNWGNRLDTCGIHRTFYALSRQIGLRVPHMEADGRVSLTTRTLNVRIPKGVKQDQMIRLAGQGAPGLAGGPPGDLFLDRLGRERERIL